MKYKIKIIKYPNSVDDTVELFEKRVQDFLDETDNVHDIRTLEGYIMIIYNG